MRKYSTKTGVPGRCRVCGKDTDPARTLCCEECEDTYLLGTDNSYLRSRVFARDEGRCARCGLDTVRLRVAYTIASTTYPQESKDNLIKLGFYLVRKTPVLWHADHIVPIKNRGALTLDNVQTLCVPCHKRKTESE